MGNSEFRQCVERLPPSDEQIMTDALADRSNEPASPGKASMDSIGPKNRLLREHELITREEQEENDEQFGEDPFGEDPFEAELRNIDQGNLQIDTANQCSEESELLNGLEYLSHARLMELTGVKDLAEVTFFEAQVDSESTSMSDLGNMLPQLTQLKLSHSNIASLRDLGTCLKHLRVLWLNRSGLLSLDGLGSISETIEELYIAFNHVTDLSPIADDDFEMLRILDCDSNEIDDPEQIEFLSGCKALHALTLENNPVFSAAGYVSIVTDNLPNLQILDDLPVDGDRPAREFVEGEAGEQLTEVDIVTESIKLSRLGYDDVEFLCGAAKDSKIPSSARPATGASRPGTGIGRPSTSGGLRPKTPFESSISSFGINQRCPTPIRPGSSAMIRPGTSARPSTGNCYSPVADTTVGSSSDLTFGSNIALCGDISRALRSRKKDVHVQSFREGEESHSPTSETEETTGWGRGILGEDQDDEPAAGEQYDIMVVEDSDDDAAAGEDAE